MAKLFPDQAVGGPDQEPLGRFGHRFGRVGRHHQVGGWLMTVERTIVKPHRHRSHIPNGSYVDRRQVVAVEHHDVARRHAGDPVVGGFGAKR